LLADTTFVEQLIRYDSGLTLLSRKNAPTIISFLYHVFKDQERTSIEQSHLQQLLSGFLQVNGNILEEEESETSVIELDYSDKARNLILSWSNEKNGFLLRYYDQAALETIELSAGLERVFRFLEEVADSKNRFVGTESRFSLILDGLKELEVNTIDNPRARIDELEKQKAQIQQQIDEIERTGTATVFNPQKVSERLYNLERTAKALLSDFRQLKDNNHAIFSELCHKQIQATESRGELLGFTLDKSEELESSAQGQSFTSFWNYLCTNPEENSIRTKTENLKSRMEEQIFDYPFFFNLEDSLIEAGREILEENRLLADRLKRAITHYNSKEYRLIKENLDAIKLLAIDKPPYKTEKIMEITGSANLFGALQRYPLLPESKLSLQKTEYGAAPQEQIDIAQLFNDLQVDESVLLENLDFDRKHVRRLTLATVLLRHPVKEGLAEIVAYLALLSKQEWATFDDTRSETVTYTNTLDGQIVSLIIPKVEIHGNDN
jgi:uncharacterized coiled-coil protein SlyX